ncbi:RelA/SpoT domain-containing protein [Paraburkholderia bryophila]|uniref:GTP pyrophosphokinase n=1 Tax=Paraburkholderia bryophila TaxID=420952 RepID=UPI0038B94533
MDLISQFVARYRKEFDFYEQSSRMAAQVLDSNLQSAGVRAIVTSRAKSPARLEEKVRQRALNKSYSSVDDIYEDIVDLAGVRVALYFPAEREEVGRIVRSLFVLVAPQKDFPTAAKPSYKKRFSGYWATHYRVRLAESMLNESQKRYAEARIEIQVASVLMHAWSEVEHDLVYKPLQGVLSEGEYSILDELNGLVLAGEIALERLQRAAEQRVSADGREFLNHYDLAASLLEMSRQRLSDLEIGDSSIGRADLLFSLLQELDLNTPEHLQKYISAIHSDFERRPIAEQVIDQVLSEDPQRYNTFERLRTFNVPLLISSTSEPPHTSQSDAIGQFIALWIEYENLIRKIASLKGIDKPGLPTSRLLRSLDDLPSEVLEASERLRRFRNQLVHGIEVPDAEFIQSQATDLQSLLSRLRDHLFPKPPSPRRAVRKTPPKKRSGA